MSVQFCRPVDKFATGPVLPKEVTLSLQIDAPNQQVPFLDRSNGIGFMRVAAWADLESGTAFRPVQIRGNDKIVL